MQTKRTYRLHAFTMQELLVGLVVSSLIIGMMYTIYAQINKQLFVYKAQQDELMTFNQFKQLLSNDVQRAKQIEKQNDGSLVLTFSDERYTYTMKEKFVIRNRNNGIRDTLAIAITKMDLDLASTEDSEYQTLRMTTHLLDEEIVLFEAKRTSVAERINALFLDEY